MKRLSNEISRNVDAFSYRKKELYKLIVARSDIAGALETCDLFLGLKNAHDELFYSTVTTVIISYSRPFSANKPFRPLPSKWGKFNNPRFDFIHGQLLNLRDQAIAHSDLSVRKILIYPPGSELPHPTTRTSPKWHAAVNRRLIQPSVLLEIRPMCYDLWDRLDAEVQKQIEELFGGKNVTSKEFELSWDN